MKKISLILFLIFLQLGIVSVSSGQTDKKTLTRKLMEKSGMNDQIRQLPLVFSAGLSQVKDKVPPEIFSSLEREILKTLDPEKILTETSKRIETNLDLKSMQEVLMWLESDLGQKITAIEKAGTTPEGVRGIEEYGALLKKTPASKKRLDLVQRFTEATNSVEMDVDIRISITHAMLMAINSALPKEKQMDADVIKKQIEGLRPKIEEEARRSAIQIDLYIYRTLKDEEFQAYVAFAESKSGKRYHKVTSGAVKDAMQRASLDFGKALGDLFKNIPRKEERAASGKTLVHLKDGTTLTWNNYMEKDDRHCTSIAGGELCINKKDVSSIEPE